jgi:hypothetical protein
MSDGRAWEGNWPARMYERVRERGYPSLTAFAEAHPTLPIVDLAQELGGDDLCAMQVFIGLVDEAERNHRLARLVRGQFVREFYESFPDGWPAVLDDANRSQVAKALALWIGYTPVTHKEHARQVTKTLLASPPPPGWRPLGPDDELLRTLIPDDEA